MQLEIQTISFKKLIYFDFFSQSSKFCLKSEEKLFSMRIVHRQYRKLTMKLLSKFIQHIAGYIEKKFRWNFFQFFKCNHRSALNIIYSKLSVKGWFFANLFPSGKGPHWEHELPNVSPQKEPHFPAQSRFRLSLRRSRKPHLGSKELRSWWIREVNIHLPRR